MKILCLAVLTWLFASCKNTPESGSPSPVPGRDEQIAFVPPSISTERGEVPFMSVVEANQWNAEIFRRLNAAFRVDAVNPDSFSKVTRTTVQRRQTLMRAAGLRLELSLGKSFHSAPEGTNGYRTSSRYFLKTSAGKILAEAESVLDADKEFQVDYSLSVFFDTDERTFLIMEKRHGAGPRYILFSGDISVGVRYVEVPLRVKASLSPMSHSVPNILGIRGGSVFVHEDGQAYAFPISGLKEVTSREFSLG
jgi:hypothetical protein